MYYPKMYCKSKWRKFLKFISYYHIGCLSFVCSQNLGFESFFFMLTMNSESNTILLGMKLKDLEMWLWKYQHWSLGEHVQELGECEPEGGGHAGPGSSHRLLWWCQVSD